MTAILKWEIKPSNLLRYSKLLTPANTRFKVSYFTLVTPNQLNFCNHPQQTVNPKANLHEALGGSSCSPGQQQPGDADIHLPGALFPSFYTSPLCNCSIVPNPSPVTQGGAGGSPGHPAYSLLTPRLHWAYAKQPGPGSFNLATNYRE